MALFHATQALLAQGGAARLARRRTKGFESGDMTRKMAETSRGATVRNVPGTRSEARRSERSVTFVTLARAGVMLCVKVITKSAVLSGLFVRDRRLYGPIARLRR